MNELFPDPEKARVIANWLATLARLTRSNEAADRDDVATYAAMLSMDFASSAFTQRSLHGVLDGLEWWPSYTELKNRLRDWLADQTPALSPPISTAGDALSTWDQRWLDFWHKRSDEIATGRADAFGGRATAVDARANLASLLRQQAPRAWALVARGEV